MIGNVLNITYKQIRATFSSLIWKMATTATIYFSHTKGILVSPGFVTVPPNILFLLFYHLFCLQHLSYLRHLIIQTLLQINGGSLYTKFQQIYLYPMRKITWLGINIDIIKH